jgi:peptide/nickel transport system ATP-binding protein
MFMKSRPPIIDIRNLTVALPGGADRPNAVEDVSFTIGEGEIVCVVGESGSGKSVTAHAIMGLLPKSLGRAQGRILFEGEDLVAASPQRMRQLRGSRLGMIFQEPMTALNPVYTVGDQIDEVLRSHLSSPARERRARVVHAMAEVGLPDPEQMQHAYPHQLSGGQRQRVLIAAAMIMQPRLLIADEPTTALDVTTQAQILRQIRDLQRSRGMGVLFITHDFGVVAEIADRVIVMRTGEVVESGTVSQVLDRPRTDYARMLIDAVPRLEAARPPRMENAPPVLTVDGVSKTYVARHLTGRTRTVPALLPTSLRVARGETVGVIGESGSGKSTLARCIANLVESSSGTVHLADDGGARPFRRRAQIVFQDPYRSLNPRRTVGQSIIEGPMNFGLPRREALARARDLMALVAMDPGALDRYPHQFSGGQRQRISIARALAMEPEVLIADEAVSALDVSVQAQVLRLIDDVQKKFELAIVFITHDLRVAAQICDRLLVMHRGEVVEQGSARAIFETPSHDYTRRLLDAVPGRRDRPALTSSSV